MTPHIVFTGGGTAGHVIPNLALIDELQQTDWAIDYIGAPHSIEENMIKAKGIRFYTVKSGKLRRHFSWKNFVDPFKILVGIIQSIAILRRLKPDVVFSKGGFVAFPVVIGAWINGIPVIAHESDLTPGLANRLCFPFVKTLCITFAEAKKAFKNQNKVIVTGTPIRPQLFQGNQEKAYQCCRFTNIKPTLLVIGGSQGSTIINTTIRKNLDALTKDFQVIHLCGKGKLDSSLMEHSLYYQMEYANDELADLFSIADMVISRAGANTLYEIVALAKPHILIPLSTQASRGDQIQNANYFAKKDMSVVISEETLTGSTLMTAIEQVQANKSIYIQNMLALNIQSATGNIIDLIKETIRVGSPKTV